MKTHEEAWEAVGTSIHVDGTKTWAKFDMNELSAQDYQAALARAKLAAQAPAMARLLLEVDASAIGSRFPEIVNVLRSAGVIP